MNDFEINREKIIIRTRPLKNGNKSIPLEMNHEGMRSTECLHLYLLRCPDRPVNKQCPPQSHKLHDGHCHIIGYNRVGCGYSSQVYPNMPLTINLESFEPSVVLENFCN